MLADALDEFGVPLGARFGSNLSMSKQFTSPLADDGPATIFHLCALELGIA
jgi:hypothetical protein